MSDLLRQLEEVRQLVIYKHQAGRHDQSAHTPKKYGGTIVPGYSDAVVEHVADYIRNRQGPEPEHADKLLNDIVLGDRNLGEWADDVLAKVRPKRLVESSEGVLDKSDLAKLRSFDKRVWNMDRELRIASDERMGGADPISVEAEYGLSRFAVRPDVAPVGKWKFGSGKFVITVNASAEDKYGLSKKHVFWHEFGHTVTDDQVRNQIGPPKPGETGGAYMDRFAVEMSGAK